MAAFKYDGKLYEAFNHMAILRNLRNIATYCDWCHVNKALKALKAGVISGKQFPFRYYTARKMIEKAKDINFKPFILDTLNECMEISIDNFPRLKGKTMCLSDNSGSAWGTFNSEYGSVTIAEIDNLSSVLTARCSDEGYVGKFGDNLKIFSVTKTDTILMQANAINANRYSDVGASTEGGIWKFFRDAIKDHDYYDNIFIYSDQQACHGDLYGTETDFDEYREYCYGTRHLGRLISNLNVFNLIQDYRKNVNPKVNVFSIQTAGYSNVVIPEQAYRTSILYGWTGKEAQYAKTMIKLWDEVESHQGT